MMIRTKTLFLTLIVALMLFAFQGIAVATLNKGDVYVFEVFKRGILSRKTSLLEFSVHVLSPSPLKLKTNFFRGSASRGQLNSPDFFFYYPDEKITSFDPEACKVLCEENAASLYLKPPITKDTLCRSCENSGISSFTIGNETTWKFTPTWVDLFDSEGVEVNRFRGDLREGRFEIAQKIPVFDLIGLLFSSCSNAVDDKNPREIFLMERDLKNKITLHRSYDTEALAVPASASGLHTDLLCEKMEGTHKGEHVFDLFISKDGRTPVKLEFSNGVAICLVRKTEMKKKSVPEQNTVESVKPEYVDGSGESTGVMDLSNEAVKLAEEKFRQCVGHPTFEKGRVSVKQENCRLEVSWAGLRKTFNVNESSFGRKVFDLIRELAEKLPEGESPYLKESWGKWQWEKDEGGVYCVFLSKDNNPASEKLYFENIKKDVFSLLVTSGTPALNRLHYKILKASGSINTTIKNECKFTYEYEIYISYRIADLQRSVFQNRNEDLKAYVIDRLKGTKWHFFSDASCTDQSIQRTEACNVNDRQTITVDLSDEAKHLMLSELRYTKHRGAVITDLAAERMGCDIRVSFIGKTPLAVEERIYHISQLQRSVLRKRWDSQDGDLNGYIVQCLNGMKWVFSSCVE